MRLLFSLLVAAFLVAQPAVAQKSDGHSGHHPAIASPVTDMTEGEIRKVDKDGARITIRHAEIKALGMPPMTMVYGVRDKALLEKVKAGDKVRFSAIDEGGRYTVARLEVTP